MRRRAELWLAWCGIAALCVVFWIGAARLVEIAIR